MILMRFDRFRELDLLAEQILSAGARALRRDDEFMVHLDVPGVGPDGIDLTVERNVVGIQARRLPARPEGHEVLIDERPHGDVTRPPFLGDNRRVALGSSGRSPTARTSSPAPCPPGSPPAASRAGPD